jgi:hypothetical protein
MTDVLHPFVLDNKLSAERLSNTTEVYSSILRLVSNQLSDDPPEQIHGHTPNVRHPKNFLCFRTGY